MIIYANPRFKRKKKVAKNPVAKKLSRSQISQFKEPLPTYDYSFRRPGYVSHGSLASTACATGRNSVMDPVSLAREPEHVRAAIIAKSKRIAIAYSKGAYQYVTDETDAKTIGRKNAV
jgi:hypothetical protein